MTQTPQDPQPPADLRRLLYEITNASGAMDLAFAASEGEVTDETLAAEALVRQLGEEGLTAFASDLATAEALQELARSEVARLQALQVRLQSRVEWSKRNLLALMGERREVQAGGRTITTRRTTRVHVPEGFDAGRLAPSMVRRIAPTPERLEVDKLAVKQAAQRDTMARAALAELGIELVTGRSVTLK